MNFKSIVVIAFVLASSVTIVGGVIGSDKCKTGETRANTCQKNSTSVCFEICTATINKNGTRYSHQNRWFPIKGGKIYKGSKRIPCYRSETCQKTPHPDFDCDAPGWDCTVQAPGEDCDMFKLIQGNWQKVPSNKDLADCDEE